MGAPVVAQQREGRLRQGHVPVVLSLPGHMDEPTGAVDLGHLEASPFQEPQATGVDRDETDPVDREAHEVENAPDLLATEHDGQRVRLRRAHQRQARERLAERVLDEELDAAQGDRDGGPRVVPVLREMEEVLAQLLVGHEVRRLVEVLRQLADGADVGLLGARRERRGAACPRACVGATVSWRSPFAGAPERSGNGVSSDHRETESRQAPTLSAAGGLSSTSALQPTPAGAIMSRRG